MRSPIKYFGSKGTFASKILEHFPEGYQTMNYIEPFCGSAALLFHKERSDVEIINDLDKNIYSLFKVLIDNSKFDEFKYKCDLSIYSEQLFKEYLKSLKNDDLSLVERAYKYFYCNRVAYNGLGGFSSSAVVRRKMSKSASDFLSAIDGLPEVHNRLSGVIIHNTDALELIQKWDKPNTFMYCDSPYALETRSSGGYKHDMTNEDQDRYIDILLGIKCARMIISGYNCDRYKALEENGYIRIDFEVKTQDTKRVAKSKIESLWIK
jgi:DNA adenine methylase